MAPRSSWHGYLRLSLVTSQPGQLITLECGQTRSRLLPAALVSVSLGDPRANGVAAWLKLAGKIVRITSSTDEVDHLPANSGEYGGRVLGIGSTSGERLRVSTKPGQSQYSRMQFRKGHARGSRDHGATGVDGVDRHSPAEDRNGLRQTDVLVSSQPGASYGNHCSSGRHGRHG